MVALHKERTIEMKITNVEHLSISDEYMIHTDEGAFKLSVTMNPQSETEPTMKVVTATGAEVDEVMENNIVELFLSTSKNPEE
jgi:hypothetical protein